MKFGQFAVTEPESDEADVEEEGYSWDDDDDDGHCGDDVGEEEEQ